MYQPSRICSDDQNFGTITRSILLENRCALRRRWRIAQDNSLDPNELSHWFPGQRTLFDILKVVTEDDVDVMADCTSPLFTIKPMGLFKIENAPHEDEMHPVDKGRSDEVYIGLLARLDAVRTAEVQARTYFGMRQEEVRWLDPFCPIELRRISFDPSARMQLAVSDKYFIASSVRQLNRSERSILATTARSNRSN